MVIFYRKKSINTTIYSCNKTLLYIYTTIITIILSSEKCFVKTKNPNICGLLSLMVNFLYCPSNNFLDIPPPKKNPTTNPLISTGIDFYNIDKTFFTFLHIYTWWTNKFLKMIWQKYTLIQQESVWTNERLKSQNWKFFTSPYYLFFFFIFTKYKIF